MPTPLPFTLPEEPTSLIPFQISNEPPMVSYTGLDSLNTRYEVHFSGTSVLLLRQPDDTYIRMGTDAQRVPVVSSAHPDNQPERNVISNSPLDRDTFEQLTNLPHLPRLPDLNALTPVHARGKKRWATRDIAQAMMLRTDTPDLKEISWISEDGDHLRLTHERLFHATQVSSLWLHIQPRDARQLQSYAIRPEIIPALRRHLRNHPHEAVMVSPQYDDEDVFMGLNQIITPDGSYSLHLSERRLTQLQWLQASTLQPASHCLVTCRAPTSAS